MSYVECENKELFPNKIDEDEYSWITKESYAEYINGWINAFNKLGRIKIIQEK